MVEKLSEKHSVECYPQAVQAKHGLYTGLCT